MGRTFMESTDSVRGTGGSQGRSRGVRWAWRQIGRLDVAGWLLLVVLLLVGLGSCFPQLSPLVAGDPERLAWWETGIRARYGRLTDLLVAIGAFHWFRLPVLGGLVVLALVTGVCAGQRWGRLWRRVSRRQVHRSDVALEATANSVRFVVPPADSVHRLVAILEGWGFRVVTETDDASGAVCLRGDRRRLAPLVTLVTHLAVMLLVGGLVVSGVFGWREEVVVGPGETVRVGHGSELTVSAEGFTIEWYPDGNVAGYEARVAVDGAQGTKRGGIRVNRPLAYGPIELLLQGYAETDAGTRLTLLAARDPGYGLVIWGGFLLLLGLTVSFTFPHVWVHACVAPDGTFRLAGRSDRWAWGFGREFEVLAEDVRGKLEGR